MGALRPGTPEARHDPAGSDRAGSGGVRQAGQRLRERGHPSEIVAHFINRLVFCMFAEDVDLLPNKMFRRMLEHTLARPDEFEGMSSDLFRAMSDGGRIGFEHVAWFNGGLFNDDFALPLVKDDISLTLLAANLDWAEIDPSILGTLFERGLDPESDPNSAPITRTGTRS